MEKPKQGVLLSGMTLPELRTRAAAAPYDEYWQLILKGFEEIVAIDAAAEGYTTHSNLSWHSITPAVVVAAVLSRVNGFILKTPHVPRG